MVQRDVCDMGNRRNKAVLCGEPWRRCGIGEISDECHVRKDDHPEDVRFEIVTVREPENERNKEDDDEVDGVEERARVIVPMEIVWVVEHALQEYRRDRAEDELIKIRHEEIMDDRIHLRDEAPEKI